MVSNGFHSLGEGHSYRCLRLILTLKIKSRNPSLFLWTDTTTVYIFLVVPHYESVNKLALPFTPLIKSNKMLFVTYTWLADVNASVAKCLCF